MAEDMESLTALTKVGVSVLKFGAVTVGVVALFNVVKFIAETVIAFT